MAPGRPGQRDAEWLASSLRRPAQPRPVGEPLPVEDVARAVAVSADDEVAARQARARRGAAGRDRREAPARRACEPTTVVGARAHASIASMASMTPRASARPAWRRPPSRPRVSAPSNHAGSSSSAVSTWWTRSFTARQISARRVVLPELCPPDHDHDVDGAGELLGGLLALARRRADRVEDAQLARSRQQRVDDLGEAPSDCVVCTTMPTRRDGKPRRAVSPADSTTIASPPACAMMPSTSGWSASPTMTTV